MSNLALPLKHRPERFEDLVGQETIAKYLAALIRRGGIGKNLILSGAYGSGKSSSCRIYARALNCLAPTDFGSPCNECEHCVAFFKQEFPDYLEVDGASSGRVESVKNLVDFAKTPPMFGKKRVINIDEAQGVSRQAFDALLKIIEEPPPWLVFIFTTTELNKIREAIQSRCQKLQVKLLDHAVAVAHLKHVCQLESLTFEDQALELIAFLSKGHPRDLLTNLEQVSFLGDITLDNTKALFNLGYIVNVRNFYLALLNGEYEAAHEALRTWADTPQVILDVLREFSLFLSYTYVQNVNVTINPVFKFLPRNDVQKIYAALQACAGRCAVQPEPAMNALVGALSKATCFTPIALELLLHDLYALCHRQGFNVAAFGQPSVEQPQTIASTGQRKAQGRKFSRDWTPAARTPAPAPVAEPVSTPESAPVQHHDPSRDFAIDSMEDPPVSESPLTKPTQLYPHTLLAEGFKPQAMASTDVHIINEDLP